MTIKQKIVKNIGLISLDNPNLNSAMRIRDLEEIAIVVESYNADPQINSIILHSGNSPNFGIGAYLPEMAKLKSKQEALDYSVRGQKAIKKVEDSPKQVIAIIKGYCLGGALELALGADYRIAKMDSRFSFPEKLIGIFPGWGGSVRARYQTGSRFAEQLITSGKSVKVNEAYERGLVDQLTNSDNIIEEMLEKLDHKNKLISLPKNDSVLGNLPSTFEEESEKFASCFENGAPKELREHRIVRATKI